MTDRTGTWRRSSEMQIGSCPDGVRGEGGTEA